MNATNSVETTQNGASAHNLNGSAEPKLDGSFPYAEPNPVRRKECAIDDIIANVETWREHLSAAIIASQSLRAWEEAGRDDNADCAERLESSVRSMLPSLENVERALEIIGEADKAIAFIASIPAEDMAVARRVSREVTGQNAGDEPRAKPAHAGAPQPLHAPRGHADNLAGWHDMLGDNLESAADAIATIIAGEIGPDEFRGEVRVGRCAAEAAVNIADALRQLRTFVSHLELGRVEGVARTAGRTTAAPATAPNGLEVHAEHIAEALDDIDVALAEAECTTDPEVTEVIRRAQEAAANIRHSVAGMRADAGKGAAQ